MNADCTVSRNATDADARRCCDELGRSSNLVLGVMAIAASALYVAAKYIVA